MRQKNDKGLKMAIQGIYRNRYAWLAFMAAFLPRFIFLFQTYPLSIGGDELFSMGPAAKLVGYDWSGVMQNYRYYGYGYTALLIPFFKLIHEPIVLYRMIVLMMMLAQSAAAPIAYHLMKKYLLVDNEKILCISSICCSYLVAVRAVYTYPEFIYVLLMWLLAWVLLKMNNTVDEIKGKAAYTLLLILILFYASTVHSRATAVWIAAAIGIIYYGWVYRKRLVSISICLLMGLAAIVVSKKGIEIVLNYFANATSSNVSNTGVSFSAAFLLKDIKSWPAWVNIIVGQLNEAVVITGGLAVFTVTAILILLWKGIRRKQNMEELQAMSPYVLVGSVFLAAIVITIAGQSVSWLPGVTNAMQNGGDPDAYRALTYFRYYGAYTGPVLMVGIACFYHKREMFGKLYLPVCIIAALMQGYWVLCILPYINNFNGCSWDFAPYSLTKGFTDEIRLRTYLPATLLVLLVLIASYLLYKKNKMHVILVILCIMLVYSYCYNAVNHEGYRGQKNYAYVDDSVHMLKQLQKTGDLPDAIYVEDASVEGTGQQTKFLYQFCMMEEQVVSSLPPEMEEKAVYLCQGQDQHQELTARGYLWGKIAENEYIYVIGNDLQKKVQENGITLK